MAFGKNHKQYRLVPTYDEADKMTIPQALTGKTLLVRIILVHFKYPPIHNCPIYKQS